MQPMPNKYNSNKSVADALIEDANNLQNIPAATYMEERLYQDTATLMIGIAALFHKEPDINLLLEKIKEDIVKRKELGLAKYGVELKPNNGRNTLLDIYEELLDATFYTKCYAMEKLNEAIS